MHVCFVVFDLFFSTKPRDWLGRTSPKWPILCRVGRKILTQFLFAMESTTVCFVSVLHV